MPGPTMIGVTFSSVPPSHVPLPFRRRLQTQELPLSERQLPQSRNRNSKRAGRLSATGGKYSFRPVLLHAAGAWVASLLVQNCSSLRQGTAGGEMPGGRAWG